LEAALRVGYRAVDTAAVYLNHRQLATGFQRLVPELGLTRADIFVTSKLAPTDQGEEKTITRSRI
jgi:diketogulonate reductase-like aldo/keto reductase